MLILLTFPNYFFIFDFILRIWFCTRILERRLPSGVAWAWLSVIFFLPIFGTILYIYLGEYRLGKRRLLRLNSTTLLIRTQIQILFAKNSNENLLREPSKSFARTVRGFFDAPLLSGNDISLLKNTDDAFNSIINDIDNSKISCDMEFYIWSDGGRADDFGEALIRATYRGVKCRVLLDQIGSSTFLKGKNAKKLTNAGINIKTAMPSGFIRSLIARPDLRMHRKLLIIDSEISYTGSLNLADPNYFKKNKKIGEWIDAICRIQGPAVEAMNFIFLSDWSVESKIDFKTLEKESHFSDIAKIKMSKIQCLPSGPELKYSHIEEVLVMAIYSARYRIVLTTPYFIPSESLLHAIMSASKRGVKVILITPEKIDSTITQYASQSYFKELVLVGVQVALYKGGMLHTKSVEVDGEFCLFGTLNLDPRSLRINFEFTLAIYDSSFALSLNELQMLYMNQSKIIGIKDFDKKQRIIEFKEDLARLLGPLL